jgi:peptidoglycan/xylan/chitin deacetylase (PgdA/CDA1 family)
MDTSPSVKRGHLKRIVRHRAAHTMTDVLVLCYHAVSVSWPSSLAVSPAKLDQQLRTLVGRGYRGATFTEAVLNPRGRPTLAVTFDDAYRSVIERAAPILKAHGIPATVFVPTDFVDRKERLSWAGIRGWEGGIHERELLPLDWAQLRELANDGWEIGSHTCSHQHLIGLDHATRADELSRSRSVVEDRLGRACTAIAYPYGAADKTVARDAAEAGYQAGAVLTSGLGPAGPLLWPRVGVYNVDSALRFGLKVSPLMRRIRARAAWRLVDAVHN